MMLKPALRPPLRAPMRGATTLREGGGVSLDAFMAAQSDGLWFDTTKTDRFFQENTGPTLADDVGEAMGLGLDQRTWGGKTLAQIISEQTELRGTGITGLLGTVTPSTYNTSTGVGTASRAGSLTDKSYVAFSVSTGKTYRVDIENTGAVTLTFRQAVSGTALFSLAAGARVQRYVVTTGNSFSIEPNGNSQDIAFTQHSLKLIPGNHGVQSSGTLKPTRQTTGAKFDGSDDHLLTPYKNGGAGDFIVALVNVPASVPTFGAIAGGRNAVDTRFFVGVAPTGVIAGGVGSTSTSVMVGTVDRRGQTVVVGLTCNGSTVRLFDDALMPYEAAQAGSIDTTVAFRIGTFSEAGGPATSYFNGSVQKIIAGREFLTLERYLQIRNALLAA